MVPSCLLLLCLGQQELMRGQRGTEQADRMLAVLGEGTIPARSHRQEACGHQPSPGPPSWATAVTSQRRATPSFKQPVGRLKPLARLICKGPGQWCWGASGTAQGLVALYLQPCCPEEKRVKAKTEESLGSDDDLGLRLFD